MKTLVQIQLVALMMFYAGCTVGPSIDRLQTLSTGQGIEVTLTGASDAMAAHNFEVLSAEDAGLYVRLTGAEDSDALYWISYDDIVRASFDAMPRLHFGGREAPTPAIKHEIRLLSRFPQGIDEELREALLRAYDQEEIATLK